MNNDPIHASILGDGPFHIFRGYTDGSKRRSSDDRKGTSPWVCRIGIEPLFERFGSLRAQTTLWSKNAFAQHSVFRLLFFCADRGGKQALGSPTVAALQLRLDDFPNTGVKLDVNKTPLSIKDFLTTTGRFPRSVFWAFLGGMYGFFAILGAVFENIKLPEWLQTTIGLTVFPMLLVAIIVQIKRWHDLNKSGWWILVNLIPCVGLFWTTIECGFIKGTGGKNRFGEDPLANSVPTAIPPAPGNPPGYQ